MLTNIIAINTFLVTCSLKTEEIENNKKKYFDKLDKVLKSQFNFYFHYENSPKYHLFLIKQILDLEILKKIVGKKNNNKNILLIKKGLNFILNISHPDKTLPFFNDTNRNYIKVDKIKKNLRLSLVI